MRLWYHPESDSYYLGGPEDTDGLAEDVTGIERHVENAKARGIEMPEIVEARQIIGGKETLLMLIEGCIKCCPNCANFNKKDEICFLNKQRPPARIIAFGCECFEEEVIPF